MSPSLCIRSLTFAFTDLRAWSDAAAPPDFTENDRQALAFCRRWLDGATEFVVRTSGSTGEPKPILLRREQMIASALATGAALGLDAGVRALICLPVRYIAGQMMLVRGLVLDMAMTLVEPASDPLAELPAGVAFDFAALVPLQMQTLLEGPRDRLDRLSRMQAILVGGGPLSETLEDRIQTIDAPVYHTYGMTETATHIALRRLNGPSASRRFRALPGVELAVDERGCLRIKGAVTLDRWLQTNDLVELQGENSFAWLGRWDNIVNTGGVKVQVERIEAALEQTLRTLGLGSFRFFVGPLPDERLGQAVVAVFEGEPLDADTENALQSDLREQLDRFELPRRFVYLPRLVETPTGKIDRQATLRFIVYTSVTVPC